MKIKKIIAMFALCAAFGGAIMPTVASAHHGGRHHGGRYGYGYGACSVDGCYRNGTHRHHGVTYYGHY